jgi:cytochrome-b5 reductase
MYQLIRRILSDPKECQTKMTLIYANKTEQDILLRQELANLEKQHPDRIDIHFTLDHASDNWRGDHGYVSLDMVRKHLPVPSTNGQPNTDIFVFVSGPEA